MNEVSDQPGWVVSILGVYQLVLCLLILLDFGINLAKCNEIWLIFLQIYGDLAEFWLDLSRFGLNHLISTELESGLLEFWPKLTIFDRERTSLWVSWVRWFLKQPNCHLN